MNFEFGFTIGIGRWLFQVLILPFRWHLAMDTSEGHDLLLRTVLVGPLGFTVVRLVE